MFVTFMRSTMASSTKSSISDINFEDSEDTGDEYISDDVEVIKQTKSSARTRLEELLEERMLAKEIADSFTFD